MTFLMLAIKQIFNIHFAQREIVLSLHKEHQKRIYKKKADLLHIFKQKTKILKAKSNFQRTVRKRRRHCILRLTANRFWEHT